MRSPRLTFGATVAVLLIGALAALSATAGVARATTAPGTRLWQKYVTSPAAGNDAETCIAKGPGGVIFEAGALAGDAVFVAKYDRSGRRLWKRTWSGPDGIGAKVNAVKADAAGNAIIAGGADTLWVGQRDTYVRKYSPRGAVLWTYDSGLIREDFATCLELGDAGFVYVGGVTTGFSSGADYSVTRLYGDSGLSEWTATYAGPGPLGDNDDVPWAMGLDADGNAYLTGISGASVAGEDEAATVKVLSTGAVDWFRRVSSPTGKAQGMDLAIHKASGQTWVTGMWQDAGSKPEVLLVNYTSDGIPAASAFTSVYGTGSYGVAVTLDAAANVVVAWNSYGTTTAYMHGMVSKYDALGSFLWSKEYAAGDAAHTSLFQDVTTDGLGNIYVCGTSGVAPGTSRFFAAKYKR